jgi:hypothetical protein
MARVPKPTVESALSLDVRRLQRERLLYPGNTFTCAWASHGHPVARVTVTVAVDEVVLEWQGGAQRVALAFTQRYRLPNHRGPSTWVWFACPQADCRRRVAALYRGDSGNFACRTCRGLNYRSVQEVLWRRSIRQVLRVRQRAGGDRSILSPLPARPPGMSASRYRRLLVRAVIAAERWAALQSGARHG